MRLPCRARCAHVHLCPRPCPCPCPRFAAIGLRPRLYRLQSPVHDAAAQHPSPHGAHEGELCGIRKLELRPLGPAAPAFSLRLLLLPGTPQARVAEFGGQVVEGPGAQPTHILCDRDMGHEELQKRMKDFQG